MTSADRRARLREIAARYPDPAAGTRATIESLPPPQMRLAFLHPWRLLAFGIAAGLAPWVVIGGVLWAIFR